MTFQVPAYLIPVVVRYNGPVDNVSATKIGDMPFDGKPFYIDVYMENDGDNTFSATVLTITVGSVTLDAISVAANTQYTRVDRDGLSSTAVIPAGADIKLAASDVADGADEGVTIVIWVYPENA